MPTPVPRAPTPDPATAPLVLPGVPVQAEIDRQLALDQAYVQGPGALAREVAA